MAPGSLSPVYLPDLGKCLAGELLLPSWDDLLDALLSHDENRSGLAVEILSGDRPKKVLSELFPTFPPPSAFSKSSFDSTTSTIASASDSLYNIDEIKADALWLSKQASLDELEALRVTVLEWQYRPESRLKKGYSEAELASLREALGSDFVEKQFQANVGSATRDDGIFDNQSCRRAGLMCRHLQQQAIVLRTRRSLLDASLLPKTKDIPLGKLQELAAGLAPKPQVSLADDIDVGVSALEEELKRLQTGQRWDLDESDFTLLNDMHDTTCLERIGTVLEIILLRGRSSKTTPSSHTLLQWLQFMASVGFFSSFNSENEIQLAAIRKIQYTASLVTAALFDLASSIASLNETALSMPSVRLNREEQYFFDADAAHEIHQLLLSQANAGNMQAGPAILAWAIVLHQIRLLASVVKEVRENHQSQNTIDGIATFDAATGRRSSFGSSASSQTSIFEEFLDKVTASNSNDDPSDVLLNMVIGQCQVFEYIGAATNLSSHPSSLLSAYQLQTLQELVTVSHSFLGYTPELVSAQLSLLSSGSDEEGERQPYDLAIEFADDEFLLQGFYDVSAARFPYECLPFLRFSSALAEANIFDDQGTHYVEHRLRKLASFTQAAVKGVEYRTIRDDETINLVALNKPINMLDLTQSRLLTYTHQESESTSVIPADAEGELISDPDSTPKVIRWQYEYSGLAYLGQLLEMRYMGLLPTALSPFDEPQAAVSEIIGLLASLLSTIHHGAFDGRSSDEVRDRCNSILNEASSHLNPEMDVVGYIFEIFEQELQSFRRRSTSSFDLRILLSCMDFIIVLTKIRPQSIWTNLNRTSLLGRQSSATIIPGLVTAVEMPLRSFDFLERCARLYTALVGLALSYSDDGFSPTPVVTARRRSMLPAGWKIQGPVLMTMTETMFNVFQEISDWAFDSQTQQLRIMSLITESFCNILRYAFDIGESLDSSSSATAVFVEPARFLALSFRAKGSDKVAVDPIVRSFFEAGNVAQPGLVSAGHRERHISQLLELATVISRYGEVQGLPLSSAEVHVFNAIPSLVRILQVKSKNRIQGLRLIRSVISYVGQHRPSSLLGHLGSASCTDFLHLLRHIDQGSHCDEERAELWKTLVLLVKDSQQWLAMVLLTGAAPDSSRKGKNGEAPTKCVRGKNFLQLAIDELSHIESLPQPVAVAMLEFVLEAQQNWPWVATNLNSSRELYGKVISYATRGDGSRNDEVQLAYQKFIATLVTDLSNTHLHHAKATRNLGAIKIFIPLINWLTSNGVQVSSYNASLHTNLRRNFAAKYNGLSVSDIKRTGLTETHYGTNFFYDLDVANKLFSEDVYWHGGGGRASHQSFSAEFRRANANLSLVDSELKLLLSLQRLCVDHCKFFVQDREIQKTMAHIVQSCLRANSQVYPAEAIFDSLFQTRADLAVALLGELIAVGARGSDFVGILEPAWGAVRFRNGSYEKAIMNDDLNYWRSTLYILLMAITFHVNKKRRPTTIPGTSTSVITFDPANTMILEIMTQIVADGFKSVVMAVQEQKQAKQNTDSTETSNSVGLRDVSLLLTLMQGILRLPTLSQFSVELSDRISSSGAASSCILLYSWSHLLTGPNFDHEPRYAVSSIQMLASLSSLPRVAEELAIEGVLSRLLTSKTTESLQRVPGGASHVDQRPSCATLYKIWSTGLLPLCLNLLHAVGGAMAPEISSFLNQFPNQLLRASTSFMLSPQSRAEGTDVLTLALASEAATLALLSRMLEAYREAGASAAIDPLTVLPLKGYEEHRKAIAEDIRDVLALKDDNRRAMTIPTDEKEFGLQTSKEGDKLDSRIVRELKMAVVALGEDDEDEK
ncbi:hypothetical protein A1O1_01671 [Capronia coronata CBS 617.96]|uniref:Nucleoporin NUP188 n=1 Tax=Capronia coronata CBS 617.96 TaxID=1182541 RepID=W9ZFI1_9EURO|nr:uncharacterized protein A1O1_01671 [Capronia coronata CBS 617.96]EXJ93279.1 hypothetical protein A1O1_01671 [Capronia coronata CBS 617.96]